MIKKYVLFTNPTEVQRFIGKNEIPPHPDSDIFVVMKKNRQRISSSKPGILFDKHKLGKTEDNSQDSYQRLNPEIRSYLLPTSEQRLKKLRTKRRRIRSHFGGYENMSLVAITVSWRPWGPSILIGIKFRISANNGIKAIDVSESYICDKILPEQRDIAAINYALITAIQLMIHGIKTDLYYDSQVMDSATWQSQPDWDNPQARLFAALSQHFPKIEYTPSSKGWFIERMREKLEDLCHGNSNEIIQGNISDILFQLPDTLLQEQGTSSKLGLLKDKIYVPSNFVNENDEINSICYGDEQ